MRGELTTRDRSGAASGTWITSMRYSDELGSWSGGRREQPASSLGERTVAEPEM